VDVHGHHSPPVHQDLAELTRAAGGALAAGLESPERGIHQAAPHEKDSRRCAANVP